MMRRLVDIGAAAAAAVYNNKRVRVRGGGRYSQEREIL